MLIVKIKKILKENKFFYYFYSLIKRYISFKIYTSIWNSFLSKLDTKQYNTNIQKYEITNSLLQNLIDKNPEKNKEKIEKLSYI